MFDRAPSRRTIIVALAACAVVTIIATVVLWQYHETAFPLIVDGSERLWAFLKQTRPAIFFAAFAILPVFGCPISPFYILAAAIYDFWFSVAMIGIFLIVSMSLAYWIASGIFRPLLEKLLARKKFKAPEVKPGEDLEVTIVLRLTPGIPYVVQNYLLGLAGIPFRIYLLVSWPIQMAWALAFLILGESAFEGRAGMAVFGLCLLVAIILITKIARNRYGSKSNRGESAPTG